MKCKVKILAKVKNTSAALFNKVEVGDILEFSVPLQGPGRRRRGVGSYASYMQVINKSSGEERIISMNLFDNIKGSFQFVEV